MTGGGKIIGNKISKQFVADQPFEYLERLFTGYLMYVSIFEYL